MVSDANELVEETLDDIEFNDEINASKPGEYVKINVGPSENRHPPRKLLEFLKSCVDRAVSVFRRTVDEREEVSASVPSRLSIRHHFGAHFVKRINLSSLMKAFMEWIKHPKNAALLLWLLCVAASAAMLGLLLLGSLNSVFPTKSSRNRWIEIINQILNALFTLMSLYQHPDLFHHLVLLCRWRSDDIVELRKFYCKNGAYRPHEWAHMMLVVLLLHVTCFSQYTLCGLYWGYSSKLRPEFPEILFFLLGSVAPIAAGLYTIYSPLGREFSSDAEELRDIRIADKACPPIAEWNGGLFDCRNDRTGGTLSFFCTFCVFGWNMERLGFGNMYVHMVTFFLLCVAPFWIFSISALNISNDVIRDIVGVSGLLLCAFGLLYGGFWRMKIREKFRIPGNSFCCGSETMTDYMQWMFCWGCSLAQEVRTVNFYDVEDVSFNGKDGETDEESCKFLEMKRVSDNQEENSLLERKCDTNGAMMAPIQPLIGSECGDDADGSVIAPSNQDAG